MIEFLFQAIGGVLFVAAVLVFTQDLLLFPGAALSSLRGRVRKPKSLPRGVESVFIQTEDGCRLEVWRLPGDLPSKAIAVVFHGNAGSLESFFLMQLWFQEQNVTSYGFDYRGFGHSSGWPNERGLDRDADAVWRYVLEREQIAPSEIIVCGFSVGGAPAARIASLHHPRLLILVSAFVSIPAVLRGHPLLKYLTRFCWNRLPTAEYVAKLRETPLLLMHGERDDIIPLSHSERLVEAFNGRAERIVIDRAGHNDVFFAGRKELAAATHRLLSVEQ